MMDAFLNCVCCRNGLFRNDNRLDSKMSFACTSYFVPIKLYKIYFCYVNNNFVIVNYFYY